MLTFCFDDPLSGFANAFFFSEKYIESAFLMGCPGPRLLPTTAHFRDDWESRDAQYTGQGGCVRACTCACVRVCVCEKERERVICAVYMLLRGWEGYRECVRGGGDTAEPVKVPQVLKDCRTSVSAVSTVCLMRPTPPTTVL